MPVVVYASNKNCSQPGGVPVHRVLLDDLGTKVLDSEVINPRFDLRNHSPDGFGWGYSGSGASQLALAVLSDYFGDDDESALRWYQRFRDEMVAHAPRTQVFECAAKGIAIWLEAKENE